MDLTMCQSLMYVFTVNYKCNFKKPHSLLLRMCEMREKTIKKSLHIAESNWCCVAPCPTAAVRPCIQHCWK